MTHEDWIDTAAHAARMSADNAGAFDDAEDAAWSGFDNLRTMIAESAPMLDWLVQAIESAYADAAAAAFGRDYLRG